MAYPKITYNPGPGTVTLDFEYPPVSKPHIPWLDAVRHDSVTCSGIRQCAVERTDEFEVLTIDFATWASGTLDDWYAFMSYALEGGSFNYYPDSALSTYTEYEVDDSKWEPKMNFKGTTKFAVKIRKVPGGAAGS